MRPKTGAQGSRTKDYGSRAADRGQRLGITRTGTLQLDTAGAPQGVCAVDFKLEGVSLLLNRSLVGQDFWAYIVERSDGVEGKLIGISTGASESSEK